jgi:hypothetical protein
MSQLFETDIGSLFPAAVPQTDKPDLSVNHGVQLLFADTNRRVAQLERDQLRLLDLIEKLVEMDKIRAQAFDLLDERVKRAAIHGGLRQQAIDLLHERISKLEKGAPQS